MDRAYNILFLGTGNTARSILAEALLNHWGQGRFHGFSAGSYPRGQIHPQALALLAEVGLPAAGLRSKSWDEFAQPSAPHMDFVFTVCDNAANEICPVWPGQPVTAHWGVVDPAACSGPPAEQRRAFRATLQEMENRIQLLLNLPIATLDRLRLGEALSHIGQGRVPPASAQD